MVSWARTTLPREKAFVEIRVLGAHNLETATTRPVAFLIDGVLALDAGGLCGGLTLHEQEQVQAILITHRHLDHVKDLATLGFNTLETGTTLVYALPSVGEALRETLLSGVLWMRLWERPTPEQPSLSLRPVAPGEGFAIGDYQVLPVTMPHSVPSVGYEVVRGERRFFYSGDTGPGCAEAWPLISPTLLAIEVTFPNRMEAVAQANYHLTPHLLQEELRTFHRLHGYLPQVLVVHMNPRLEAEMRAELTQVAQATGAAITPACEGMVIHLQSHA